MVVELIGGDSTWVAELRLVRSDRGHCSSILAHHKGQRKQACQPPFRCLLHSLIELGLALSRNLFFVDRAASTKC